MNSLKSDAVRFNEFIRELEKLTRKTGIVIKVIGGVYIVDNIKDVENITYTNDYTSNDIIPQNF